jgi:phosphate/sulfate permease
MNKNNIPKSILEEIDKVADGSINNAMEVSKSLDNWIIGAVVGLFTASSGFIQLSDSVITWSIVIYFAWLLSLVPLVIILWISYEVIKYDRKTYKDHKNLKNLLISEVPDSSKIGAAIDEIKHKKRSTFNIEKITEYQYPIAMITLLLSFILLIIFSIHNIKEKNKVVIIKKSLDIEKQNLEILLLKKQLNSIK